MSHIAVDFGTSNTLVARLDADSGDVQSLALPGISRAVRYRMRSEDDVRTIHLIPTLIHYQGERTLIGGQVVAGDLVEHPQTFRWMKRSIAIGSTKVKKTPNGPKTAQQAAADFLTLTLNYLQDQISFADDEFTLTAPVEAFEDFEDWLLGVAESIGVRRVRPLDEATACILGHDVTARRDDRFLIFDFGCGTLDVSVVRLDLESASGRKAVQLGKAGLDLGGMDIDSWMVADFCERHEIDAAARRRLEPVLLVAAEQVKMDLSRPSVEAQDLVLPAATRRAADGVSTPLRTTYVRSCPRCGVASKQSSRTVHPEVADDLTSCLGCLLGRHDFLRLVRETVDRALENAAIKAGVRRSDLRRVLVTGGTSLVPAVRAFLAEAFPNKVALESPFAAVACGACKGVVTPILQHDYAVESYSSERRDYEFKALFHCGAEYPTSESERVRFWAKGSYDGMRRIGIKVFEVSQMQKRGLDMALVDESGALRDLSRVASQYEYICLNHNNPTFIIADPPIEMSRDARRFLCTFCIDSMRRLLVTVEDQLADRVLLVDHPVVRL